MTHTRNGYFSSVGDYFGLDGSEWIGLTCLCCTIPRLKHWSATPLMKVGRIWSEYSWPGLDGRSSGLHAVWLKCQLGVLHQQFANLTGPKKHHIQSEWCACNNNKQSFNSQLLVIWSYLSYNQTLQTLKLRFKLIVTLGLIQTVTVFYPLV